MIDRKQELQSLLDKVEAGERGDGLNTSSVFSSPSDMNAVDAFDGSLDAAKALHEAVLPDGEGWEVYRTGKYPGMIPGSSPYAYAARVGYGAMSSGNNDNPARAWLIAILRALMKQEGGAHE